MEWSHWFAGFCVGGGLALWWASYVVDRQTERWMVLFERMSMDAAFFPDDEEEYDESESWKYN